MDITFAVRLTVARKDSLQGHCHWRLAWQGLQSDEYRDMRSRHHPHPGGGAVLLNLTITGIFAQGNVITLNAALYIMKSIKGNTHAIYNVCGVGIRRQCGTHIGGALCMITTLGQGLDAKHIDATGTGAIKKRRHRKLRLWLCRSPFLLEAMYSSAARELGFATKPPHI